MGKAKQDLRSADAPLYRYWQALYLSFFSGRLYVDVAKRWRGFGVLYLLLAISIAAIPLSMRIIFVFEHVFEEQLSQPLKDLPPLYVQNGKIVIDKPMPYFIKNKQGVTVAIVDTTGSVSKIDEKYPGLTILITKNTIYFRPPKFELFSNTEIPTTGDNLYAQKIGKSFNEVFVGKEWLRSSGVYRLKYLSECLVYPVVTAFVFSLYAIVLFVMAVVAQLFAQVIFNLKLTFPEACRLFMVASTGQIALFFVTLTFNITLPGAGILYIAVLAAYFSFAIISVREESKKMVFS